MIDLGQRMRDGIARQAESHGVGVRQTGPVQMPMVLFDNDTELELGYAFTTAALRSGVYLHPWHNMFLSAAHTDQDIDTLLDCTNEAMSSVAKKL